MIASSRPLRALGLVLGGWTTIRLVALWPGGTAAEVSLPNAVAVQEPNGGIVAPFQSQEQASAARVRLAPSRAVERRGRQFRPAATASATPASASDPGAWHQSDISGVARPAMAFGVSIARPLAPGLPGVAPARRISGSAWTLLRSNSAPALATGGQLGGSQIGVRLFYTPGPQAIAVTTRFSMPLAERIGREAALGIALRGRNAGIIAEQRFALDRGGADAPAIFAYGGVDGITLPGQLTLDGYAQAGVVGIRKPLGFVDGAIRVERAIVRTERAGLSIGIGAWAGRQPGAARIDIGPQMVARIAVAETGVRVSGEWRQRVAGNAAPASGPAVTVGIDF